MTQIKNLYHSLLTIHDNLRKKERCLSSPQTKYTNKDRTKTNKNNNKTITKTSLTVYLCISYFLVQNCILFVICSHKTTTKETTLTGSNLEDTKVPDNALECLNIVSSIDLLIEWLQRGLLTSLHWFLQTDPVRPSSKPYSFPAHRDWTINDTCSSRIWTISTFSYGL